MPPKPADRGYAMEARMVNVEALGPGLEGLELTMSEFRATIIEMQQSHLQMQRTMVEKFQQTQESLGALQKDISKIGGKRAEGQSGKAIPIDGSSSSTERLVREPTKQLATAIPGQQILSRNNRN